MKKIKIIISILIFIILITNIVFATTDFLEGAQDYMPSDPEEIGELEHAGGVILSVITTIGIIVSVVMCAVLGVKYMLGSVEEKATFKQDMIPYLVGACLLFGSGTTIRILQSMGSKISEHYPHNWNSGVVAAQPTCSSKGTTRYTCIACGASEERIDININSANHKWNEGEITINPTCETIGTKKYTCEENSAHTKLETISLLSHDWDGGVVTAEPTCINVGVNTYTCKHNSSHTRNETISALGHTEVIDAARAATCTATGLTQGKHCSKCNTVLVAQATIPATGHTEVIDAARAATCTVTGLTQGKHCSKCNTVLVAQATIPATGHTEVIDAARAATCTATGLTQGKHCSKCNTVLVAQATIPATGHTEVIDAARAATCTATGLTQGKHCSKCNAVTVAQVIVPKSSHLIIEQVNGGTLYYKCRTCDQEWFIR